MSRSPADRCEQAALWVARMDGGHWSAGDEAELQEWLSLDALHAGALLQAQAAWASTDPALFAAAAPASVNDRTISRRRFAAFGGAAVALSVAGGLLLTGGRSTEFRTDVGEIRRVPLADGSIATINTASEVKVVYADDRRAVRLGEGEAWFQVAKDPARPFVVEAGTVRVAAIGTAFSVRRRDEGVDVLVTEGVVDVWVEGKSAKRFRVNAGSRAFVTGDEGVTREPAEPSSVDRSLAWRSGKIDLLGERLDSAVAEFNRYNRRRLVIADPALASEQLDGVFGIDDPDGFAKAVASTLDTPIDLSNPGEVRIGRPGK